MRFRITWHNDDWYTGYKVSIPCYDGGEVVSIDEVQEIEDALEKSKRQIDENAVLISALVEELKKLKKESGCEKPESS